MKEEIVSKEIQDYIFEQNKKTPYHRLLDMNITELKKGYCKAVLVVDEKHVNPMKVSHGGVIFSILDMVSGSAARTEGYEIVTTEMNISYFNPSYIGDELIAEGRVLKLGKRIIVVDGKLYHGDKLLSVSRQNLINLGPLEIK